MVLWASVWGTSVWLLCVLPWAAEIASLCSCVCVFLPHSDQEGFSKFNKGCPRALTETSRLAERAVCHICVLDNLNCWPFFLTLRPSFIHYFSKTREHVHTYTHTQRYCLISLHYSVHVFDLFLFFSTFMTIPHGDAPDHTKKALGRSPQGAKAFSVWTLCVVPDTQLAFKLTLGVNVTVIGRLSSYFNLRVHIVKSFWNTTKTLTWSSGLDSYTKCVFCLYLLPVLLKLGIPLLLTRTGAQDVPFHEHLLEVVPSQRAQTVTAWNSSQARG